VVAHETVIELAGISGKEIIDFFLNCDDAQYQEWWPGTHLQFHTLKRSPDDIGSVVFMDEYIGKERLRMKGIVLRVIPGKALVVQLTMLFRLPFWIHIETADGDGSTTLTHRIEAGFRGVGRILDPLLRGLFVRTHAAAMDEHARTEFPKLRDMLLRKRAAGGRTP
jgi:hypothetical protein